MYYNYSYKNYKANWQKNFNWFYLNIQTTTKKEIKYREHITFMITCVIQVQLNLYEIKAEVNYGHS